MSTVSIGPVVPDRAGPEGEDQLPPGRRDAGAPHRTSGSVVAALGLLLVAVVIVAVGLGVSFVRLATGSMSPLYPADSILLVRSVPAASVRVGDVVTVSQDGTVPITHRVVAVAPASGGSAQLTLRGDANEVPDPEPYHVARVGLVLGGIPFGGSVLVAVQSPVGLGVATVIVALLVLWAWWPRRRPLHLAEST